MSLHAGSALRSYGASPAALDDGVVAREVASTVDPLATDVAVVGLHEVAPLEPLQPADDLAVGAQRDVDIAQIDEEVVCGPSRCRAAAAWLGYG